VTTAAAAEGVENSWSDKLCCVSGSVIVVTQTLNCLNLHRKLLDTEEINAQTGLKIMPDTRKMIAKQLIYLVPFCIISQGQWHYIYFLITYIITECQARRFLSSPMTALLRVNEVLCIQL
jgi:hypothetical protein